MVERFFVNKVGNAVEDLVQETFTRCVASRERIRDNDQFRLYLFGLAYNTLTTYLRERSRDGQPVDWNEASMGNLAPAPTSMAVARHEHRLLLEALRSIPVVEQVLVELHYWENITNEDIAETLGIPVATVRGRLQRARARLGETMQRLTESHDPPPTVARLEDWARSCRTQLDRGHRPRARVDAFLRGVAARRTAPAASRD